MIEMIEPYRNVRVEHKKYTNGRGGKGSVAGSSEILLICTPKIKEWQTSENETCFFVTRIKNQRISR